MENISLVIGHNLMQLRKNRKLSLDKLAALTGVSKAMLGQIERGESNPTVATLWKIAIGLHVSFSELIVEKKSPVELIRHTQINPLDDAVDGLKAFPLFPFEQDRKFEIFTINLEPGSSHSSSPHDIGTEEYLIVSSGCIQVTVDSTTYEMYTGDAMRFQANKAHTYCNTTKQVACFQNIIYYGS
ncbi:helix-turn-helix transcriptional regulator [bacterium BFN5]|nr:helix-turn-helix transcriptional regulator [bacterium BFN5]QJW45143.1 helix-turn-helix transcriptional regulator [bacterium BFN5]